MPVVEERNVVLAVAAEQNVPHQARNDVVRDTLAAALRHLTRGRFVLLGDEHEMHATINACVATTARRIVWERRQRERVERDARMPSTLTIRARCMRP